MGQHTHPNLPPPPHTSQATAPPTLRRSFYLPVHAGPVKCVAAAAPFVATGGADDTVHLFDVAVRRRERERENERERERHTAASKREGV